MLRWFIGIILGEIICKSSNWQHIQRLNITILGANWQFFRLERIVILFCLYTKHQVLLICNENKESLCCQLDDTIEVYFHLGINIWSLRSEWVNTYLGVPANAHTHTAEDLWSEVGGSAAQGLHQGLLPDKLGQAKVCHLDDGLLVVIH